MDPFDPNWTFEVLVENLNAEHRPGSLTSGKTRNTLLRAWALCVGRQRARTELAETIGRHGSRSQMRKALRMSAGVLSEYEHFLSGVPERGVLPADAPTLRSAFASLAEGAKADFLKVAAELLQEPVLLHRLALPEAGRLATVLGSAVRVLDLRVAVEELERMLDGGAVAERQYQDWCDRHSWSFGNAYVLRDDVRRLDAANTVDLLLPNLVGYRDIVELKRPDEHVLRWDASHKTHYFSAACSRAIGQVHKYMDRLHEAARHGLSGHPHVVAYHPHATIVLGRSAEWTGRQTRSLRGLNERLHGVTVMTYDHLLAQARQLLTTVGVPATTS